jgi:hypothetical protein
MSDIQRWRLNGGSIKGDGAGPYVRYADHVEALRQAESREWAAGHRAAVAQESAAYEQGQRDEREKAVQRVEALQHKAAVEGWRILPEAAVIAAIKWDSPEPSFIDFNPEED